MSDSTTSAAPPSISIRRCGASLSRKSIISASTPGSGARSRRSMPTTLPRAGAPTRPAARRCTPSRDARSWLDEAIFVVDLEGLEAGSRTPPFAFGARHIGVFELPLESPLRGGSALLGCLDAYLEGARTTALGLRAP